MIPEVALGSPRARVRAQVCVVYTTTLATSASARHGSVSTVASTAGDRSPGAAGLQPEAVYRTVTFQDSTGWGQEAPEGWGGEFIPKGSLLGSLL